MKFTQFLFPNRTRKEVTIELGIITERFATELSAAGWRFEVECNSRNEMVHGDCCNDAGQLAMFLEPNGPGVPRAIESMVDEAYLRWMKAGKPPANSPEAARLVEGDE